MSNLLKSLDGYNEFARNAYFILCYNSLPSSLTLDTPLDSNKENIEIVLEALKLKENKFEIVFKNWNTEDDNDADSSKDYPYKLLYKGIEKSCTIWIELEDNSLEVEFLYDCKNEELEKWVIQTNSDLRGKFGLDSSPKFKVLSKRFNSFSTESVRTNTVSINIEEHYNDDFKLVNEKIIASIRTESSGLILLNGEPGTGKTTYIRSLITQYYDLNFIFVQNEFINNLLDPDFISFLLKQRNAILVIEDAEKVITSREYVKENSVVSTVLQLTDGLFSSYLNIKVICTFNTSSSKIDTALLRKGRMIAMYEFKELSLEKTNRLLEKIGEEPQNKSMTISNIFNFKEENFNKSTKKIGFVN